MARAAPSQPACSGLNEWPMAIESPAHCAAERGAEGAARNPYQMVVSRSPRNFLGLAKQLSS